MKKKILSLFLALTLCLSLLPTAAFAADGAQDPAEPGEEILAPEQLEDPEKDPDPEQEDPSVKQDEVVAAVQALMDALPGEVTADNADELQAQLMAIDAALEELTDEQTAKLDMARYKAVCEVLSSLTAVQAGETHTHCFCGDKSCNKVHTTSTTYSNAISQDSEGNLLVNGEKLEKKTYHTTDGTFIGYCYEFSGGYYYLAQNIVLKDAYIRILESVNGLYLCLNGHNLSSAASGRVIHLKNSVSNATNNTAKLVLCDCKGDGDTYGKITHE